MLSTYTNILWYYEKMCLKSNYNQLHSLHINHAETWRHATSSSTRTRRWKSPTSACRAAASTWTHVTRRCRCAGCRWRRCATICIPARATCGHLVSCCGKSARWAAFPIRPSAITICSPSCWTVSVWSGQPTAQSTCTGWCWPAGRKRPTIGRRSQTLCSIWSRRTAAVCTSTSTSWAETTRFRQRASRCCSWVRWRPTPAVAAVSQTGSWCRCGWRRRDDDQRIPPRTQRRAHDDRRSGGFPGINAYVPERGFLAAVFADLFISVSDGCATEYVSCNVIWVNSKHNDIIMCSLNRDLQIHVDNFECIYGYGLDDGGHRYVYAQLIIHQEGWKGGH